MPPKRAKKASASTKKSVPKAKRGHGGSSDGRPSPFKRAKTGAGAAGAPADPVEHTPPPSDHEDGTEWPDAPAETGEGSGGGGVLPGMISALRKAIGNNKRVDMATVIKAAVPIAWAAAKSPADMSKDPDMITGRIKFESIPRPITSALLELHMEANDLTMEDMNVVCAPEFGTNLRLVDGALALVTIAYMGMELQHTWPSVIMAGKFGHDSPLIMEFLYSVFALELATDVEVLNFLKLQSMMQTMPTKGEIYLLSRDKVETLAEQGVHEDFNEEDKKKTEEDLAVILETRKDLQYALRASREARKGSDSEEA